MKADRPLRAMDAGASLIEVLLAMGVLAVALPLVFGVLARSGQTTASAQAETRCVIIIPACLDEIATARAGQPRLLPDLARSAAFPAAGDVLALGFAADGRALGCVERDAYRSGVRTLAGEPIRYLASIHSQPVPARSNTPDMLGLRVTLEYPSAAPHARRHKLDFFTRIP